MASEEKRVRSPEGLEAVEAIREFPKDLPEATEAVDKFGHTSFRVRDKPFVCPWRMSNPLASASQNPRSS